MAGISVPKYLDTALGIFYDSLRKGEMPNVKRVSPEDGNWSEWLAKVKGASLDSYDLAPRSRGQEPDGSHVVTLKTRKRKGRPAIYIPIGFCKVEGEWAIAIVKFMNADTFESTICH